MIVRQLSFRWRQCSGPLLCSLQELNLCISNCRPSAPLLRLFRIPSDPNPMTLKWPFDALRSHIYWLISSILSRWFTKPGGGGPFPGSHANIGGLRSLQTRKVLALLRDLTLILHLLRVACMLAMDVFATSLSPPTTTTCWGKLLLYTFSHDWYSSCKRAPGMLSTS